MREFWNRLLGHTVKTVWIVLFVAVVGLGAGLFWLWPSFTSLVLITAALVLLLLFALRAGKADDRHSLEGLAAFLSSIALVMAGYWFFVERRSVPKLNVTPAIQTWPIGDGRAFARVELLLENVGDTDITLKPEDPFRLEIGQVLPLAGNQAKQLQDGFREIGPGDPPLSILQTDKYPARGVIKRGLDLKIESGETEKRYFKAVVPCVDGLILSARADVPKRLSWLQRLFEKDKRQHFWRGQAISERIERC